MTNTIFIIPPSEGKNTWWNLWKESTFLSFSQPKIIAENATEKDLKCSWKRYEQWISLNKDINKSSSEILRSIERYSWVMYHAIDYTGMTEAWREFFENNFLILSGMYGILTPLNMIGNYKLPIETKWLYDFWWEQILDAIDSMNIEYVVNLLPMSYAKLIYGRNKTLEKQYTEKRKFQIININFLKPDGWKMAHGVKKIKGEWIKSICNKKISDYRDFWGEIVERENNIIDINIVVD